MPALGMTQDEGVIVAWLKAAGDAVAEGDPLIEVETDKATMELEAQGAGFLTDIRAGEGDSVPVGQVIAVIADTVDGAGSNAAGTSEAGSGEGEANAAGVTNDDAPAEPATDPPDDPAEGRDVIMPALGMAQDTGRLVAWLVAPGGQVAEGDPLFEVETDKATMEVPAECGGYLAAIHSGAGADVPVGTVIGVLSATEPQAPVRGATPSGTAERTEDAPAAAPAVRTATMPAPGHRVLASPKARRLAAERGLDLERLARAGIAQPFHVRDLDRPEARPAAEGHAAEAAIPAMHRMTARAPAAAFDDFTTWAGDAESTERLMPALAAAALRAHTGADRVMIELRRPGTAPARHTDPDLARPQDDDETPPALILHDLTATRLTGIETGGDVPVAWVARDGAAFALAIAYHPDAMEEETAAATLSGLADRLADPMRQLF